MAEFLSCNLGVCCTFVVFGVVFNIVSLLRKKKHLKWWEDLVFFTCFQAMVNTKGENKRHWVNDGRVQTSWCSYRVCLYKGSHANIPKSEDFGIDICHLKLFCQKGKGIIVVVIRDISTHCRCLNVSLRTIKVVSWHTY